MRNQIEKSEEKWVKMEPEGTILMSGGYTFIFKDKIIYHIYVYSNILTIEHFILIKLYTKWMKW